MVNLSHIEDDDGVQLCPMSASVTEQDDLRFADPAAHVIHICVIVAVVVVTDVVFMVLPSLLFLSFLCCAV